VGKVLANTHGKPSVKEQKVVAGTVELMIEEQLYGVRNRKDEAVERLSALDAKKREWEAVLARESAEESDLLKALDAIRRAGL
jgi:hypothetical protein